MIKMTQNKKTQRDQLNALAFQYQDMADNVHGVRHEVDRQNMQLFDINEDLYDIDGELNKQDKLVGTVEKDWCCGNLAKILLCQCFRYCCLSAEDSFDVDEEISKRKKIRKAQFSRGSRPQYGQKSVELSGRSDAFKNALDELRWAAEDLGEANREERNNIHQVGDHIQYTNARTRNHNKRMNKLAHW